MSALMFHFFSFLDFDLYFERHILGNFRSYELVFIAMVSSLIARGWVRPQTL